MTTQENTTAMTSQTTTPLCAVCQSRPAVGVTEATDAGPAIPRCWDCAASTCGAFHTFPEGMALLLDAHAEEGQQLLEELRDIQERLAAWQDAQRALIPEEATVDRTAPGYGFTREDPEPDFLARNWHLGRIIHGPGFDVSLEQDITYLAERVADVRSCQVAPATEEAPAEKPELTPVPAESQPAFQEGDRVFSHYAMQWGTVEAEDHTVRGSTHGVTGDALPDTTWYRVRMDDGSQELLDDAHGNWDLARIIPPAVASRYGYGADPKGSR